MANNKYQSQFDQWKTIVIIPTYNNAATLREVIDAVLGTHA